MVAPDRFEQRRREFRLDKTGGKGETTAGAHI
jgi:hypothetical protein